MIIIEKSTILNDLWVKRDIDFNELMKVVVDINRGILAIDAEMHADLENLLLENGSQQQDLWGANVYPNRINDDFIEYTSFINIRPNQKNRSMEIQDNDIRDRVKEIIKTLLTT